MGTIEDIQVETRGTSLKEQGPSLLMVMFAGLTVLFTALFTAFVFVDVAIQQQDAEEALLEEARMFAREMDAVWGFMDHAQYTINTTSNGEYEFKGLHCAIVGKSVGAIFSKDNDYTIRYTNFNPRNVQDYPDAFETEALELFNSNPKYYEYYGVAEFNGEEKFRYARALEVDETCLECHGDPVGEMDKTGFVREGWTMDSVGGAISIVIPIDQQRESMRATIFRDSGMFLLMMSIIGITVMLIVQITVMRPLNRMEKAFGHMQGGELGVSLEANRNVREMRRLIDRFNVMNSNLAAMYQNIESEVRSRTIDLQQANELLEQQAADLSRLNVQLAKETQFKTDLLSMVNHELRTPLTAIITLAQIARDAIAQNDPHKSAWAEVENNSRILLDMINDMLDIARSDAGMIKASREVMDLGDVVSSVKQSLGPIAQKYEVALTSHIDGAVPLVVGDYEKMTRIFTNLISNAIKFTPDGGWTRVEAVYDLSHDQVICSVTDNGIGIAEEDQQRVFDRFVQVDSTSTRKYNGSGLGLAIVREYAELQGFSVELESQLGQGSCFKIIIPSACLVKGDEDV